MSVYNLIVTLILAVYLNDSTDKCEHIAEAPKLYAELR